MQSNFIKITFRHGCSPVNLLHIFRTLFLKNTSQRLKGLVHTDIEFMKKRGSRKTKKLLGCFATTRLIHDRKTLEPNEVLSRDCTWDHLLRKLRSYYKPTENPIIRNVEFRQLVQVTNEIFSAFCNRVEAAGKTCTFCKRDRDCSTEEYAIRDQIVTGTTNKKIGTLPSFVRKE